MKTREPIQSAAGASGAAISNGDLVSNLELAMANSAFGYEYALQALEEEGDLGLRAEQIQAEMENLKNAYFSARDQLRNMDASRLEIFEVALKAEKSVIFTKTQYLH